MNHEQSSKIHIVEVNLISAEALKPVRMTTDMQTYAVAWIDPKRKLTSRIDTMGRENPTWNDKFVFTIDENTLNNLNSSLIIEIYCVQCFRNDKLVGTARILLDNFICGSNRYLEGMKGTFRAFHVRRPSGKPQGILNVGVVILDELSHQVMSEFVRLNSAVDYKKLMGVTNEAVERRWGIRAMDIGVKCCFYCGLVPGKKRSPKKIYQWPYEAYVREEVSSNKSLASYFINPLRKLYS